MPYNYNPKPQKHTLYDKPCQECGKMHRRKKFCSVICGSRYNNRLSSDPQFSRSKISSIIRGESSGICDNSYAFVFSNRIEDWIGSKLRVKREQDAIKRKAKKRSKVENEDQ